MKNKNKLATGLAALTIAATGLTSGCTPNIQNAFYNDPLNRAILSPLPRILQPEGAVRAYEGERLEEMMRDKQQKQTDEIELLVYNKWVDINQDNLIDYNELFGLKRKNFNLDKEDMRVLLWSRNYHGNIIFRSWNSKGELIGETNTYNPVGKVKRASTGPGGPTQGDFMDNIKGAGPGEYKITATLDDKRTFVIDVIIE